jgi:hypothetical protein
MLQATLLASLFAGISSVVAAPTTLEPRITFPSITTTSGAWTATTCALLSFSSLFLATTLPDLFYP